MKFRNFERRLKKTGEEKLELETQMLYSYSHFHIPTLFK